MFFSLQKLLYRNHKYSIKLLIVIIQSSDFYITYFHNKKILFSFYHSVIFQKMKLSHRSFLVAAWMRFQVYTDDDDSEVDFDVIAWKVFGASIQDIIDIESEVITCDDTMHDWDAPADILEKFRGMKKKSKRSQMMMREMKTHLIQSFQISLLLLSTLVLLKSLLLIIECHIT